MRFRTFLWCSKTFSTAVLCCCPSCGVYYRASSPLLYANSYVEFIEILLPSKYTGNRKRLIMYAKNIICRFSHRENRSFVRRLRFGFRRKTVLQSAHSVVKLPWNELYFITVLIILINCNKKYQLLAYYTIIILLCIYRFIGTFSSCFISLLGKLLHCSA